MDGKTCNRELVEIKKLKVRPIAKYRNSPIQTPVLKSKILRVILISQRYKWLNINKEHPVSELGQFSGIFGYLAFFL